jgi:3,4-dihydroxy 2-butanone 4-phosphate synthase/GTP cyclohydrolase II
MEHSRPGDAIGLYIDEVACAELPTSHARGALTGRAFRGRQDGTEHLAIVKGRPGRGALVRIHSECLTGDALGSLRCDCGEQLRLATALIDASEAGVLIYVRRHEGGGIGLANKIAAYALQDQGLDTQDANTALGFPPDARDYTVAPQILHALGVDDILLLTNNPLKAAALRRCCVAVRSEVPLVLRPNAHNTRYLATKRDRMGHRLPARLSAPSELPL